MGKVEVTEEQVTALTTQLCGTFSTEEIESLCFQGEPQEAGLRRFLQARKFNFEKTCAMIKEALEWRAKHHPKKLLELADKSEILGCDVDEMLQFYSGAYAQGVDKMGRPIWYERTGKIDVTALHCLTTDDKFLDYHVCGMEELGHKYLESSTKTGKTVNSTFSVLDMEGLSMTKLGGETMDIVKRITATDSLNYPETMGKMFVINAPAIFSAAWSVVQGFLDPRTVSKIEICGGPSDWQPKILNHVDPENLPAELKGSGPACLPTQPCFTEVSLASTEVKNFPMEVKAGEKVKYKFFVRAASNISFAASFTAQGAPQPMPVIPSKDYASAECSNGACVTGVFEAPGDGVFTMTFEHKGWWSRVVMFRAKKL